MSQTLINECSFGYSYGHIGFKKPSIRDAVLKDAYQRLLKRLEGTDTCHLLINKKTYKEILVPRYFRLVNLFQYFSMSLNTQYLDFIKEASKIYYKPDGPVLALQVKNKELIREYRIEFNIPRMERGMLYWFVGRSYKI